MRITDSPRRNKKGVTLLELIVVVVILGILAAIAIPALRSVETKSQNAATAYSLSEFQHQAWLMALQNGQSGYSTGDFPNQDGNFGAAGAGTLADGSYAGVRVNSQYDDPSTGPTQISLGFPSAGPTSSVFLAMRSNSGDCIYGTASDGNLSDVTTDSNTGDACQAEDYVFNSNGGAEHPADNAGEAIAPTFSSASSDSVAAAQQFSFAVTTTGTPEPTTITMSGAPSGVGFSDSGGDAGLLSGTVEIPGTYALTFTATSAAGQTTQEFTLTVTALNQSITFTSTAPSAATVGGATYTPTATSTSGLAVALTVDSLSSGVCSISGGVVSFQSAGTCTVDANQAGDTDWNAATQQVQSFTVTGLTITSAQSSGSTSSNPEFTLSGDGSTGATSVSVAICKADIFPCTGVHLATTVTTGTSPTNPWTTAATGATTLAYSTTYYAEATQGAQSSPVFTFTTPAQLAPTAVTLANGGVSNKIDTGDTATVTFSTQLNASTICSTWANTGSQTVTNATITVTTGSSLTATSSTCGAGGSHFGTVSTAAYVKSTGATFTNSTITWNPATDTLTFTLGTVGTGAANVNTNVTAGKPGYTPDTNMASISSVPVTTGLFSSGTVSGF
jgi:prepilin-type N-terminal cleavage/methylation domain-containing protein